MKADSSVALDQTQLPLLRICSDHSGYATAPINEALDALITRALTRIDSPVRDALAQLFLGDQRWEPLGRRGAAAASRLGITYDALRRRGRDGNRQMDSLLSKLAESILDDIPLSQLLFESDTPPQHPNPGVTAVERASIFLSYSRADDQHEGNFVSRLRESLISEFRFQTGQDLIVFQDKTNIDLGENWRRKVQTLIDTTSYLLVILTPSYLRSETCREELERFLERERQVQRDDLVLPIYYATVTENSGDPLVGTLLGRQYIDWRNLRFHSFDDVPVRMAVAALATSIAAALARTAELPRPIIGETVTEDVGLVERLAKMELALPRFVRSMLTLGEEQQGVNEEVQQATEEVERLNRAGRGSTARLVVARRLVSQLEPHAERMEDAADSIRADLATIEDGIEGMAVELPSSDEEGVEDAIRKMIVALQETLDASIEASRSIEAMAESYSGVARTVSTLRPILNRLLASAKVVADCPERFRSWIERLEGGLSARSS
jgi:hypothetical protein